MGTTKATGGANRVERIQKRELAITGKGKAREAICRHRAENDGQKRADRANHDAIDEIRNRAAPAEDE